MHEKDLNLLSIQSEFINKEAMLHKENNSFASECKKLLSVYNDLRFDYTIEQFQLEIISNPSISSSSSSLIKNRSMGVKSKWREIESMLKEIKGSFIQIISSNCNEIKEINSFYKENSKYIHQCYLNTFISLNSLIYQMDNDVKQSIEISVNSISNEHNNKMASRIQWITEQNELLLKYKEEHMKQNMIIERLETDNAILKDKNDLLKKELDEYVKLVEQLQDTITNMSSELLELKLSP